MYEDDFDAIMATIDTDMLHNDEDLNLQINSCVKNMPSMAKFCFQYEFCKVCLSSDSLKRHVTIKAPIFQDSGDIIIRLSCLRFSSLSRNETGPTNFKRFVNLLKMNVTLNVNEKMHVTLTKLQKHIRSYNRVS